MRYAFIFLFLSSVAQAAISFDASAGNGGTGGGNVLSWTHTCATNASILIVGVNADSATTTGVTYNAVSMTKIASLSNGVGEVSEWYLKNPSTGANTVQASLNGALITVQGGSVSLIGTSGSPLDASNVSSGTATTASVSVTTIANNTWIVDTVGNSAAFNAGGAWTASGQTSRFTTSGNGNSNSPANIGVGTLGPNTPPGSFTASWTQTGSNAWAMVGASFAPSPTGGIDDPTEMLLGPNIEQ